MPAIDVAWPCALGETAESSTATMSASSPNESSAGAIEEIMPAVYEELRRLATGYLRGERAEHTLQRTALVHEAYLRLRNQERIAWENPAHFVGIFARVMRETLINHAVAKHRLKRGGTGAGATDARVLRRPQDRCAGAR